MEVRECFSSPEILELKAQCELARYRVAAPIVCNVPSDSLDPFSKSFQDIFVEGVINCLSWSYNFFVYNAMAVEKSNNNGFHPGSAHACFFRMRRIFVSHSTLWKQHKLLFDKECVDFLDHRKQAKMQWIQDPNRSNVNNLKNIRRDASRHFRNKKAYLKVKIEEPETNNKINNVRDLYRGINVFKKGYQPRTTIVKDEKGDLVADSHSIMAR